MERLYSNSNVKASNESEERYDEDSATTYNVEIRDTAKPDLICYSIVIDAFTNSRLPEAGIVSYRLLGALESKYNAGDFSMKPNTRIYSAVIQSLIHSEFIGKFSDCKDADDQQWINNAQVAMYILETKMRRSGVHPNAFTYNYIMNCAAECQCHKLTEARASFEVAVRAFQQLRSLSSEESGETSPDSFTYAFMLKACNNHLPKGSSLRIKTLKHTFEECCRTGNLNNAVLNRLYNGVSSDGEFSDLTGIALPSYKAHDFSLDISNLNLPLAWSRNVVKYTSKGKNLQRSKVASRLHR
jgi:hypothetical protein